MATQGLTVRDHSGSGHPSGQRSPATVNEIFADGVARTKQRIGIVPQNLAYMVGDFLFPAGSTSALMDRFVPADLAFKEESLVLGQTIGVLDWRM